MLCLCHHLLEYVPFNKSETHVRNKFLVLSFNMLFVEQELINHLILTYLTFVLCHRIPNTISGVIACRGTWQVLSYMTARQVDERFIICECIEFRTPSFNQFCKQQIIFTWTTSSHTISALSFSCRQALCDVACIIWHRPIDVRTLTCLHFCSLSRYPPALEIMTLINTFESIELSILSNPCTTYRQQWQI